MMKIDYKNAYENVMMANHLLEKETERLKNLLQKKWEETSKYVEIADDYEKRLNKAIEYIKEHTNNCMFELRSDTNEIEELLNILKGVDKVWK